jgi:hypothetical protein
MDARNCGNCDINDENARDAFRDGVPACARARGEAILWRQEVLMPRSLSAALTASLVAALVLDGAAFAKPCPNVMLVLDASGSMLDDPSGRPPEDPAFVGPSKWKLLTDVVTSVLTDYGDFVPFGLMMFSGGGSDDITCAQECMVQIPVAHDSAPKILQTLKMTTPDVNAETPTNGAIHVARMDQALMNPLKEEIIILVTDGDPNCGSDKRYADPVNHQIPTDSMYPGTIFSELTAALQSKPAIKTFVIGFDGDTTGNGVNTVNLENMGYYGGNKKMGCGTGNVHCYYSAGANFADFKTVFDGIISQLGGEFQLVCDDSCYSNPCPPGQICTTEETNPAPHCINDPCMGAKCSGTQFCRLGQCVNSCGPACSKMGQVCVDGACMPDLCPATKKCGSGQVCDPKTGVCIDYPCLQCAKGSICDVHGGKCVSQQCNIITCPKGFTCVNNGNCEGGGTATGGCSCKVPPERAAAFDPINSVAGGALIFSMIMMMIRRRRRA